LGNGFVGLAFVLTPLAIVTLINDFKVSYTVALSAIGGVVLLFALFACVAEYPSVATGFKPVMAVGLLGHPAVLVAALALVCYIGLEFTMNAWLKPLMTELFGGSKAPNAVRNAGRALALFGLAMAVGRFITATVSNLSQIGTRIIAGASLVSIIAIGILYAAKSPAVAIFAILLIGLAFAPMFPTIVGVTFSKFSPHLYGSIFGIIFSVGLLGPTFLPKIIGNVSESGGVQQSLPIAAIVAGVLFVIALAMGKVPVPKDEG